MSPKSQRMERKSGKKWLLSKSVLCIHRISLTHLFWLTGRTGPPHGLCCRAHPCSLQRVRGAAPAGYVSCDLWLLLLLFFFFKSFHLFLWYFPFPYSCVFTGLHAICVVTFVNFCSLVFSSSLWSLTTAATLSQSCSSLFLAAGSTQSSPVPLSPMWTVGPVRLPLYVPSLSACAPTSLPFVHSPLLWLTRRLTDVCLSSLTHLNFTLEKQRFRERSKDSFKGCVIFILLS